MSSLHTVIPTPNFCSFWHGHPYILLHFLKMFYILYYCVVALVQGHDLYNYVHVSQFTQRTPAHSHVASHRHEYDYKGHDLEQELLHSSIVSRKLSLSYHTLLHTCMHTFFGLQAVSAQNYELSLQSQIESVCIYVM